ncbi:MAG: hypothetical protein A2X13_06885 [Bacteroidetes bacterium GWC2_33_15]|nr:MAG: hypothetical protein A2X10_02315 [Bacteroidetes bacterium GWA2_33_15]OFX52506.1 MAG: hypothetical protein A2X13_06885 [Bacteroidetes bacterium GWC2_33_15]OFX65567.1 MAG: hypothetical protein A2X15_15000 [Bacteroidetes bacterium GWB2_32_14]OFX67588.1 MAG: hypothetical protein A2X14_11720 [Bacteroidetes bacterium GWD2_33_33]HAN18365.1 hypothetical protein [Bacteroidales bacterium]
MKIKPLLKESKTTFVFLFTGLLLLLEISVPQEGISQTFSKRQTYKYLVEEVMPVMKPYRYEFEKQLTSDEINQIESIRKELKTISEIRREAEVEKCINTIHSDTLADRQADILNETRKRFFNVMIQALEITNTHDKELQNIYLKEEENVKIWILALQEILLDNQGKHFKELNPVLKHNIQKLIPVERLSKVVFVIWNPDQQMANNF